jgi:hypothetical protein
VEPSESDWETAVWLEAEAKRLREALAEAKAALLLVRKCGGGGAKLSREASDNVKAWLAKHETL